MTTAIELIQTALAHLEVDSAPGVTFEVDGTDYSLVWQRILGPDVIEAGIWDDTDPAESVEVVNMRVSFEVMSA